MLLLAFTLLDSQWFLVVFYSVLRLFFFFFFFFQAEDGIRDLTVTGVQTCALPIFELRWRFNGVAAARMASANPTISSTVSPFMCSATSRAAICASVHLPDRISAVTARASSRESDSRQSAIRCRASRIMEWV